jgi:prepilin-type processing-associated H-X9-DG protein
MRWSDVVVLILIVAIGLGLLAGGVSRVNDASFRASCQNNLKLIELACLNYHDSFKCFLTGTIGKEKLPPEKGFSWMILIVPYVECSKSGLGIDYAKAWDAEENQKALAVPNPFYLCPANPDRTTPAGAALSHYVGIGGVGPRAPFLPGDHPRAGIFRYGTRKTLAKEEAEIRFQGTSLDDIKDERATTLMIMETNSENGPWMASGPATVRGLDPDRPPYLGVGGQFGSYHGHGSNAAFADGSVRFLANSLDPKVFEAMATIAGREKVELPE